MDEQNRTERGDKPQSGELRVMSKALCDGCCLYVCLFFLSEFLLINTIIKYLLYEQSKARITR